MVKIVLVSGKARSGKDYLANKLEWYIEFVQHKRCLVLHYADALKDFCSKHYGYADKKDSREREMLQTIGTDIGRTNYEDTWVDIVIALIRGLGCTYDFVLIPDARFPNEIQKIIDTFGKENTYSLRTFRDFTTDLTTEQQNHTSETALDDWCFDEFVNTDHIELDEIYKNIVK